MQKARSAWFCGSGRWAEDKRQILNSFSYTEIQTSGAVENRGIILKDMTLAAHAAGVGVGRKGRSSSQ